jgi:prepilin-type N-terminal cleavage/methylation domain-containing protein
MRRESGFTLIELVLVMLVISAGLLGLTKLFSRTSTALSTNETLQQAAQYAQECAEQVILKRREKAFLWADITPTMCDTNAPLTGTGFARTVTVNGFVVGTSDPPSACPNARSCKNISILVTKGTVNANVTLMLVDY